MIAPRMRAGNSDRQAAVDRLTRHFTEGRLDAGEFDERVGQAYAATHLDQLPDLLADLPEYRPHRGSSPAARWSDPDSSAPFHPVDRPGPWSRPHRTQVRRPPMFLAVIAVLALLFSIGMLTHGAFSFPLIWIAIVLLIATRRGRRRRRTESSYRRR